MASAFTGGLDSCITPTPSRTSNVTTGGMADTVGAEREGGMSPDARVGGCARRVDASSSAFRRETKSRAGLTGAPRI